MKTIIFHTGKGGRFNNGGHKKFICVLDNPMDIISKIENSGTNLFETEQEGETWYVDHSGRGCSTGEIESGNFRFDFDGEYDTWHGSTISNLSEQEIELIREANERGEYIPNDVAAELGLAELL